MENYTEISPYSDDEVPGIIRRLKDNQVFLSKFSQFSFPIISSIFPLLGNLLFNETLDYISMLGMGLIIFSGTLTIINTPKLKI